MAYGETYEEFVNKFKPKKTTDDCYTPPAVYDCVLQWLKEKVNLQGLEIKSPFYPNGNYENEIYTENSVVVDNPPFSIISKIIRFYNERNIKYFLFAPHLTLFSPNQDYTAVVCSADIAYENGAKVKTSFVSNLFGDVKILGVADLHQRLKEVQNENKKCLPCYQYSENVITVSRISQIVEKGVSVEISKKEVVFCRQMDAQKELKKTLFGCGFLTTDKVAQELKAQELKIQKEKIVFELSERERKIVEALG